MAVQQHQSAKGLPGQANVCQRSTTDLHTIIKDAGYRESGADIPAAVGGTLSLVLRLQRNGRHEDKQLTQQSSCAEVREAETSSWRQA